MQVSADGVHRCGAEVAVWFPVQELPLPKHQYRTGLPTRDLSIIIHSRTSERRPFVGFASALGLHIVSHDIRASHHRHRCHEIGTRLVTDY